MKIPNHQFNINRRDLEKQDWVTFSSIENVAPGYDTCQAQIHLLQVEPPRLRQQILMLHLCHRDIMRKVENNDSCQALN